MAETKTNADFLSGYKTYIVVGLTVVYVAYGLYTGSLTLQQAMEVLMPILGIGAVRSAIKKVE